MKDFKTYSQQILILKKRGVVVKNEEKAINILRNTNYYTLINGYKNLFQKVNTDEQYIEGVKLEEVYALYNFDRELRAILMDVLLEVENKFKSIVAYEFSKQYGFEHYMKLESFNLEDVNIQRLKKYEERITNINKLIGDVQNVVSKGYSKKDYVKHHINKYGYVPLWVLVNTFTFTIISRFYSLMKQSEKVAVAKHYSLNYKHLNRYMKVLSTVRNVCAHNERLYNIELKGKASEINDTKFHNELGIAKVNGTYTKGKKDFLAVIITLKEVLDRKTFKKVINIIEHNLKNLTNQLKSIDISVVKDEMGLVDNWKQMVDID